MGMSTVKKLLKKDMVKRLKDVVFDKDKLCSACQASEQVAITHPTKAFMLNIMIIRTYAHGLIWTSNNASVTCDLYCLVVVNNYSRFTWAFFLQDKAELHQHSRSLPRKHKMSF